MKRIAIILGAIGGIVLAAFLIFSLWAAHLTRINDAIRLLTEGNPTDEQVVAFLKSRNHLVLVNALGLLERRKVPEGREPAAKLLAHPDLYVWYCAGLYLGAVGDQRSVPYLIRGLDHPGWRSRPRVVQYLKDVTGQDHGDRKQEWVDWWSSQHPGSTFDFVCRAKERPSGTK